MMGNKKIILAKAGAGKTQYVTSHSDFIGKRILYLTYTNENIFNIKSRINASDHEIKNVTVSTYHSFLLNYFFRPFVHVFENETSGKFDLNPEMNWVRSTDIPRRKGIKMNTAAYWIDENGRLYGNRLSNFILHVDTAFKKGMRRLEKYYDLLVVDEFQDFTENDFKLLRQIFHELEIDILYVGDVYQANVTQTGSSLAPYNKDIIDEVTFISNLFEMQKIKGEVDNYSFRDSKRITKAVADFVREKLNINITSNRIDDGDISFQTENNIENILQSVDVILTFNKKTEIPIEYVNKQMNWSVSKGMTFKNVAVVLTGKTYQKLNDPENIRLKNGTHNKLYVALTRATGNVYLFDNKTWKVYVEKAMALYTEGEVEQLRLF